MVTVLDLVNKASVKATSKAHRPDHCPEEAEWIRVRLLSHAATAKRAISFAQTSWLRLRRAGCLVSRRVLGEEALATFMIMGEICTRACAL